MFPLWWYSHPWEQQVLGIVHPLLLTTSDSQPQAGQKVPDADLRVHNIPGGANFKDQLERTWGKKNPQPKPAPVCTLDEHRGRKGWKKEQGFSISLVRGVPTFNLRWGLTYSATGPDLRGKTSCSPISPLRHGAASICLHTKTPQSHPVTPT